jgi:hypothetical protein
MPLARRPSERFVIYALEEGGKVAYVGCTNQHPATRLYQHCRSIDGCGRHGRDRKAWIRSLLGDGKVPALRVLAVHLDEVRANQDEAAWIRRFRAGGTALRNSPWVDHRDPGKRPTFASSRRWIPPGMSSEEPEVGALLWLSPAATKAVLAKAAAVKADEARWASSVKARQRG